MRMLLRLLGNNSQQQKNWWMRPCRIEEKWRSVLPRASVLFTFVYLWQIYDAINSSEYKESNGWDEWRKIWKEAVVVLFTFISLHLPRVTEKTTKYQTRGIQSTIEVDTTQMHVRSCLDAEVSFRIVALIVLGVFCFPVCLTTLFAANVVCENGGCGWCNEKTTVEKVSFKVSCSKILWLKYSWL
jgi:hypothetical protein